MLEDNTCVGFEPKRRLPVWMLAAGTADKVSESKNEGTQQSEPSRPSKRRDTKSKVDVFEQEMDVVKLERPKTTRKSSKNIADSGSEYKMQDEEMKKNITLRAKKKQNVDLHECQGSGDRIEDEVKLTVDDLISIAQECVGCAESTDDDGIKQLEEISAKGESISKALNSTLSSSSGSNATLESSFREAVDARDGVSKCTLSSLPETDHMNEILENNLSLHKTTTGDAAQDMLDLFLGPLLKNPSDTEALKFETNIGEELRIGVQSSKQVGSSVDMHVVKKKSSLKDKVAMFLE